MQPPGRTSYNGPLGPGEEGSAAGPPKKAQDMPTYQEKGGQAKKGMMAHIRLAQERRLKQEEDNPQALDPPNPARVEKRLQKNTQGDRPQGKGS